MGLARIGGLVFCAHAGFSCGGLNIAEHQIDALYAGAGELVADAQDGVVGGFWVGLDYDGAVWGLGADAFDIGTHRFDQ